MRGAGSTMPRALSFSAEGFRVSACSENLRLHFSDHVLGMILQAIELLVTAGVAPQGPPCAPRRPGAAVAVPTLCQGLACFLVPLHVFDQEGGNRVCSAVFIGIVCSCLHLVGEESVWLFLSVRPGLGGQDRFSSVLLGELTC